MSERLYRSNENRMLLGVCGGIAERLDLDPTMVRLAFVLFAIMGGTALLAYLVMALVIPRNPALTAGPSMRAIQQSPPPGGRSMDRD
ncbi:PspC domain-containing protein [Pseudenhygromyxa sp. WMMC2535]|uniref:PspC domain-containing protein n=1 Tax=Pseudenhygromyxa sp. WMMC2535 TaxID=2712867 RepID=UPI001552AAB9|nr:PspC domain-containing protein [Pseudenhygromyxa sp. WMMC2535]NVB43203.1 PspC domain-containing protein [Pseudenhygromyxa sp. WMMC2535]